MDAIECWIHNVTFNHFSDAHRRGMLSSVQQAWRVALVTVVVSCMSLAARRVSAQSLALIPAGLDVGRSHHSRTGAGPRVGLDVSIVNIEPSLLWYGAFAGANYARGAELAFGPELGIAVLGIDAGPVWRSSEPGHGWGIRTRAHVTWLFTSFYAGYAVFPQSGSNVLELGLQWKCIPVLVSALLHPGEDLGTSVERSGWSRKSSIAALSDSPQVRARGR